jgi:putative spermidine/putrescine transport system substrate-binding protein
LPQPRPVAAPSPIWAQNIKDVVLRHNGTPVTAMLVVIGDLANKDLGFNIQMQASEGNDLLDRLLTAPMSIDCADISITFLKYLVGRDVLQGVPVAKVKDRDKTIPVHTKGEYPDGRKAPRQGTAPWTVIHATDAGGQTFHDGPSEWLTVLSMITNRDTPGSGPT